MKFLLTFGGIRNASLHNALVRLLGKPVHDLESPRDTARTRCAAQGRGRSAHTRAAGHGPGLAPQARSQAAAKVDALASNDRDEMEVLTLRVVVDGRRVPPGRPESLHRRLSRPRRVPCTSGAVTTLGGPPRSVRQASLSHPPPRWMCRSNRFMNRSRSASSTPSNA